MNIKTSDNTEKKINTHLLLYFLFQFGILYPVSVYTASMMPIVISTLLILLISIINNGLKVNTRLFILILAVSLYFALDILFISSTRGVVINTYFQFIYKCVPALYIGFQEIDNEELVNNINKYAYLNVIILLISPYIGLYKAGEYMRYGYAILPSLTAFILFFNEGNNKKVKLKIILSILGLINILLFANRGPILIFAILFLTSRVILNNNIMSKTLNLSLAIIGIYVFMRKDFVIRVLNFLNKFVGGKAYSINKILLMINQGVAQSSSGREILYYNISGLIKDNILVGSGISITLKLWGFTPHNVVLQILAESGIVGLVAWLIIWIYMFTKLYNYMKNNNRFNGLFIVMVCIIAFGRLMVSSDMWLRTEYWLAIAMILKIKKRKKNLL